MFNKLFGRSKKEDIDLSFGYARTEEFKKYLSTAAYETFEKEYEGLEWDAQTLLNEAIGLDLELADQINQWVDKSPDSYVSNLFAGVSKTAAAWKARTAAMGSKVSQKNADLFFEYLEQASEYLAIADEINPDHPEISARSIRVYMGLGVDKEATMTYFNAAIEIVPDHLMTHIMMISYLSPKWRGSMDAMHDFANERIEATNNSLLVTLKLFAITEEWVYYGMTDETSKYNQFFKNDVLKNEIEQLYNDYVEQDNGHLLIPYAYNYFAFLFWQLGNKDKSRQIIKKIPGQMTIYPWAYMGIETNEKLQKL